MARLNSNCKLLLHLDGTDGSTTFTDSSASGHSFTAVGTAQLDTADYKWGTASLLLDGDSDSIYSADSADWDIFAQTNFTVDLWFKQTAIDVNRYFFTQSETNDDRWFFYIRSTNDFYLVVNSGGISIITCLSTGITCTDTTSWHHVALIKVGTDYGIYLDGTQIAYTSDADSDTYAASLYIGERSNGAMWFPGWMYEICISHDNYFGAVPNVGKTDTIVVPKRQYSNMRQRIITV